MKHFQPQLLNSVRLSGFPIAGCQRVLRSQTHHFLMRRRWTAGHDHWNLQSNEINTSDRFALSHARRVFTMQRLRRKFHSCRCPDERRRNFSRNHNSNRRSGGHRRVVRRRAIQVPLKRRDKINDLPRRAAVTKKSQPRRLIKGCVNLVVPAAKRRPIPS